MKLLGNKFLPWIITIIFIIIIYTAQFFSFRIMFGKLLALFLLTISLGVLIKAILKFSTVKKSHFVILVGGVITLIYYSWTNLVNPNPYLSYLDDIIIISAVIAIIPAAIDMSPQQATLYYHILHELKKTRTFYTWLWIFAVILLVIFVLLFFILLSPYYRLK